MLLEDREFDISISPGHKGLLACLEESLVPAFGNGAYPVRFTITETTDTHYHCELGVISALDQKRFTPPNSIFRFNKHTFENQSHTVFVSLRQVS